MIHFNKTKIENHKKYIWRDIAKHLLAVDDFCQSSAYYWSPTVDKEILNKSSVFIIQVFHNS